MNTCSQEKSSGTRSSAAGGNRGSDPGAGDNGNAGSSPVGSQQRFVEENKAPKRRMSLTERAKLRELEGLVRSRMPLFPDEAFQLRQLRAKAEVCRG